LAVEDQYNFSREALMARIAVGLGGRVAVELIFGPEGVTTGAEDDFRVATSLAWRMVTHWGMGKQLGAVFADGCKAEPEAITNSILHTVSTQPPHFISTENSLMPQREKMVAEQHEYAILPPTRYISSASMATLVDCEVHSMLREGRATAYTLLSKQYDQLTRLTQALIEHEQLNRAQIEAVLQE
jgi:ATP-dependent Zn protease